MKALTWTGLGFLVAVFSIASAEASRARKLSPMPATLSCAQVPAGPLASSPRPNPHRPIGHRNADIPIRHIVVIMQENRSFDSYFGRLSQERFYGSALDGLDLRMFNLDENGQPVYVFHQPSLCVQDLDHSEDGMADAWNGGLNDGFVKTMGPGAMGYYDESDLSYYYELANQFATADRYFSSFMGPTTPNRFFLLAGTAFGHIENDLPSDDSEFNQRTVFDALDEAGISWKYYTEYYDDFGGLPGYLSLFRPLMKRDFNKIGTIADYHNDVAAGRLPEVVFIDANERAGEDEHPPSDIQIGQKWVSERVASLVNSRYWRDSVVFLTYDENGGFFDHVAPPNACAPDALRPEMFSHLGFRVPFLAISPYVKHHFVSHQVYDHTSVLRFIETKFNLPFLSARDAAANDLSDLFDYTNPVYEVNLPGAEIDSARFCKIRRRTAR